jgi:hypothetical protein
MITKIPENQICQAFDPMMYLPEKTKNIIEDSLKASTSCVAPAYVYIEGSRGKRFLCDFHYYYEKNMTKSSTPHLWPEIEKFKIDERELIKKTFSRDTQTNEIVDVKCSISTSGNHGPSESYHLGLSCSSDALVKVINKLDLGVTYFCNFHFRKNYYRSYSNNIIYEDKFYIIDERYRMKMSIAEESESLNLV